MSILPFAKDINARLAVTVTLGMGTMTCVYLFLVWSLLPLAFPSMEALCMYVSTTVIQLVALPLIMVGQNHMGAAQRKQAREDHETLLATLSGMQRLLAANLNDRATIDRLESAVTRIEARIG